MVSSIEYIKLRIATTPLIISVLGFYHKLIMIKIDEKIGQKLYDKEIEYMKTQTKYNCTNLKEKIETVSEDIKIIKESILNK